LPHAPSPTTTTFRRKGLRIFPILQDALRQFKTISQIAMDRGIYQGLFLTTQAVAITKQELRGDLKKKDKLKKVLFAFSSHL
jgi:hypothetical protein